MHKEHHHQTSNVNLNQVAKVLAIIGNVLLGITGLVGCIFSAGVFSYFSFAPTVAHINGGWAIFFFCIGLILFCILGILGELQIKVYLDSVSIWVKFWTRGVWYTVMGFFALGISGALGIATGFYLFFVAIFMFILQCLTHSA